MSVNLTTTMISGVVIAACVLLSGCSEPGTLSDYSTEEIVAEYHRRFDSVMNGPGKEIYAITVAAGQDISVLRNNQELNELRRQTYEQLLPYAEAGNVSASALVGSLMALDGKEYTDPCKAIVLTAKAAREGDPISAFNLGMEYRTGKYVEKNSKLAYFWVKEAYHRSGTSAQTLQFMFEKDMSDAEKQQALEEWSEWFPLHSEVILNSDYCG